MACDELIILPFSLRIITRLTLVVKTIEVLT